jgi:hypothetical protein
MHALPGLSWLCNFKEGGDNNSRAMNNEPPDLAKQRVTTRQSTIKQSAGPLRLIVCSAGYSGRFAATYYSFDKKFIAAFTRLGHSVIHVRDRDIARHGLGIHWLGSAMASRTLRGIVEAFRPHVIALFHADKITNATLSDIRKSYPDCRIVDIDCDLIELPRRLKRVLDRGRVVDATLITSGGISLQRLRAAGLRAGYVPNPTDASMEVDQDFSQDKTWDLIYVSSDKLHSRRWDLIRNIAAVAPDLKVGMFGSDMKRILGLRYFELLSTSKAALNWSLRNDIELYSSDRIAQLFGCGLCVCLPRSSGFQRFLDEKSAIFFASADDLVQRLRAAVRSGEWIEIGRTGCNAYRALFGAERVAQYVLDFLLERATTAYEWSDV